MTNTRENDQSGLLFDYLKERHKLKRDADLARFLGTAKSYISDIRNGRAEIGAAMLIRICEKSKISLKLAVSKAKGRS